MNYNNINIFYENSYGQHLSYQVKKRRDRSSTFSQPSTHSPLRHQTCYRQQTKIISKDSEVLFILICRNNKVALNNNPQQHVNKLYSNLYKKTQVSVLDNKATNYEDMKHLLSDKIKKSKYEKFAQS